MPLADVQTNGTATGPSGHLDGLLPGTTFPAQKESSHATASPPSPTTFEGTPVNGRSTTVTLLSAAQLRTSSLLPSLVDIINAAFERGHSLDGSVLIPHKRLRYDGQLLDELGSHPATFTYIISYAGTHDVAATASAKRYHGVLAMVEQDQMAIKNTFRRLGPVPEGVEAWELSTMAVDPGLFRQGLAGLLMRITEEEVVRRFKRENEGTEMRLVMMLTTIKSINGAFYAKRGWGFDYEVEYPKGHIDCTVPFTVIHMSREVSSTSQ